MLSSGSASAPNASAEYHVAHDASPARILIIDDDEDTRILLNTWLETLGHKVSTVTSGEESLKWLQRDSADVLFLDLEMTGMNGLDVLSHIREEKLDVAVVLTTANGSEDVAVAALRVGADDYLRKPFNHCDLEAVLARTTHKLSLSRKNQSLEKQLTTELFHAQLDLTTGVLRYVDAGHGHVVLRRADGRTERLPAQGLRLGVLDKELYAEGLVTIGAGDVLIIYSDGLTQALPKLFGKDDKDPLAEGAAEVIVQDLIDRATSAGPLTDDLTVGVLRRVPVVAPDAALTGDAGGVQSDTTAIYAQVNPVLQPLLPTFLTRRHQDVTLIKQELKREGFRAIETIGHNLKGIGGSYGFDGISDIGRALEQAAQRRDADEIRARARQLSEYLRRVRIEPP